MENKIIDIAGNDLTQLVNNNVRTCSSCGSTQNKFKSSGKKCIKCYSKKNNDTLKAKEYYKNYYLAHDGLNRKRKEVKENDDIIV